MEPPYAEIRDIIQHFAAIPHVSGEALKEFCERKGYKPLSPNDYEDWLYQHNADVRTAAFVKDAMQVIGRYRPKSTLATQAENDEVDAEHNGIEVDMCNLLEKHEILYDRYMDSMLGELAGALSAIPQRAATRANNMAARLLTEYAEENLGSPLTFKHLGEEFRKRHAEKKHDVPGKGKLSK